MDLTWIGWSWRNDHPGVATRVGDIPDTYPIAITDCKMIQKYNGYGTDGNGDGLCDPWNEVDAIYATAQYLAKNGAANGEIESAIRAYNHSDSYVQSVIQKASEFSVPVDAGNSSHSPFTGIFHWPVPTLSNITSPFGVRTDPINGNKKEHRGIDISGPNALGAPLHASASGIITVRYDSGGYGNYIVIEHENGYTSLYGHLQSVTVHTGQVVRQGQVIGYVGNTGRSTGPHLHFEIRRNNIPLNPLDFVRR
ncbi:M23 family metallopeptidase [Risungbinella massiliensis]|uniref:M23 family metallopeptidase n=1 Tax=Risungbinella massiliensis TaxID=1329796 RepID=UPI00069C8F2A|nr:M23 family metallopeptidase [Risungbinella massiliensis]